MRPELGVLIEQRIRARGGTGIRTGLKIPRVTPMWVRIPPRPPKYMFDCLVNGV